MTDQVPETDGGLAEQQNRAQDRLRAANGRLWSGLHPDALGLVYGGAAAAGYGASAIRNGIGDALPTGGLAAEVEALVLSELHAVHWAIYRAFSEHQQLAEDRRHLAAEIGELIAALVSELIAAGWSEEAARTADVRQLTTAVAR